MYPGLGDVIGPNVGAWPARKIDTRYTTLFLVPDQWQNQYFGATGWAAIDGAVPMSGAGAETLYYWHLLVSMTAPGNTPKGFFVDARDTTVPDEIRAWFGNYYSAPWFLLRTFLQQHYGTQFGPSQGTLNDGTQLTDIDQLTDDFSTLATRIRRLQVSQTFNAWSPAGGGSFPADPGIKGVPYTPDQAAVALMGVINGMWARLLSQFPEVSQLLGGSPYPNAAITPGVVVAGLTTNAAGQSVPIAVVRPITVDPASGQPVVGTPQVIPATPGGADSAPPVTSYVAPIPTFQVCGYDINRVYKCQSYTAMSYYQALLAQNAPAVQLDAARIAAGVASNGGEITVVGGGGGGGGSIMAQQIQPVDTVVVAPETGEVLLSGDSGGPSSNSIPPPPQPRSNLGLLVVGAGLLALAFRRGR